MIRRFNAVRQAAVASSFVRNFAAVLSGTASTQAIIFIFSPLLSRIFDLAEFGNLANYNAWVAVLALVSNLRYEHAVLVARTPAAMYRTIALTLVLSLCAVVAYTAFIAGLWLVPLGGYLEQLRNIAPFIPLGVLSVCLASVFIQVHVRTGRFKRIAWVAVAQVVLTILPQILLGLADVEHALIIGTVAGYVLAGLVLGWFFFREHDVAAVRRAAAPRMLWETAREHLNFPRYTLPADGISVAVQQFIPVFVLALFSPAIAGLYSFAIRVVRVPSLIVSTAVAGPLRREAIERVHDGRSLGTLFSTTVRSMFAISIVPFAIVLLFGQELFALVFGSQWRDAGLMIQILSPGILFEFVAIPLSAFFLVTSTQRYTFVVQIVGFGLMVAALLAGKHLLSDFMATCYLVSAVMIVANLLGIVLAAKVAASRLVTAPAGS